MHKKNRANQSIFYHDVVTQHVLTVIMHHFALTNLLKRESPFFLVWNEKAELHVNRNEPFKVTRPQH